MQNITVLDAVTKKWLLREYQVHPKKYIMPPPTYQFLVALLLRDTFIGAKHFKIFQILNSNYSNNCIFEIP